MASKRSISVKDVAREAGVSIGAVSVVLNKSRGNIGVSAATRKRIEAAAKKLGYQRNAAASALRRRSARTLGLYLTPRPEAALSAVPYEAALLQGIEEACLERGFDVLVLNLSGDRTLKDCTALIGQHRIDGILIIDPTEEHKGLRGVRPFSHRLSLIGKRPAGIRLPSFSFDNRAAVELAIDHLAGLGHRRIGYVGQFRDAPMSDSLERTQAFYDILAERNIPLRDRWVFDYDHEPEMELDGFLKKTARNPPTAILAFNDIAAVQTCKGLAALGLQVPEEISVIGIDDNFFCELVTPSLTSIRQPIRAMGRAATLDLIRRLSALETDGEAKDVDLEHRIFEPALVIRESTAAPTAKTR